MAEPQDGMPVGIAEQNRNSLKNSKRMDSRSLAGKMSIVVVVELEAGRLEMDNTTEELDLDSKQRRTESHWLERKLVERRFVQNTAEVVAELGTGGSVASHMMACKHLAGRP